MPKDAVPNTPAFANNTWPALMAELLRFALIGARSELARVTKRIEELEAKAPIDVDANNSAA